MRTLVAFFVLVVFASVSLAQQELPVPDRPGQPVFTSSVSTQPQSERPAQFKIPGKRASQYTPEDWGALIDSTWGPGQSAADQRLVFNTFWNAIDQRWGGFPNLPANVWDSLRNEYRPQIPDSGSGLSRGRFYGLMSRMRLGLMELHTRIIDWRVDTTFGWEGWGYPNTFHYRPGVPLLITGTYQPNIFGAAVTPLPDSTNLVYRAAPGNPLGLVPGDLVLGYEGVPWKQLYRQLLDAGLPVSFFNSWSGSTPESQTHFFLMAVGHNWGLFDTIDIVKYSSGDTLHLPTALLDTTVQTVWESDQVPVAGVPMPEAPTGSVAVSWGVVQGTNVGYIYVWDWASEETSTLFQSAVWELLYAGVEGLVIDFRMNWGGSASRANGGLSQLFNFDPSVNFRLADRTDPNNHMGFTLTEPTDWMFQPGSSSYDHPIAVLIGPGCFSAGDHNASRIRFHPMARFFGKPTDGAFVRGGYLSSDFSDFWRYRFNTTIVYSTIPGEGYLIHKGVQPDEEVWLTREGVANGEDDVVKRALTWIDSLNTPVHRVPQDHATIQAAINAALPHDTVLVDHGTYFENILINKRNINVASRYIRDSDSAHISATVINGNTPHHPDSGATVTFGILADTTSIISGFTITGGSGNRDTYAPYPWPGTIRLGGGVVVEQRGTIRRNIITGNTILPATDDVGAYGAGIALATFLNSYAIIEDNVIMRNVIRLATGDRDVAGAGLLFPGNGRIVGNIVSEDTISCVSGSGGAAGMYVGDCTSLLVANNAIEHNFFEITGTASDAVIGGGIGSRRGSVTFIGNRVHGNTITSAGGYDSRGGGIAVSNLLDTVLFVLSGNHLDSNRAVSSASSGSYGGGLYVYNTRAVLENNAIDHNEATYGGGVWLGSISGEHRTQIINNTIIGNSAITHGGGVFSASTNPLVLNSIVYGNSAFANPEIRGTCTAVYSDIGGGYAGTGNIDAPPQFSPGSFSLSDTSPCLGAGIDSVNIGGAWYVAPDHCMMGSLRPSPSWSMPDLGACENSLPSPFARMICSPESFSPWIGEWDSTASTLTIGNVGGTSLDWTIATDPAVMKSLSWLSVSPSSGTILPGGETPVTVTMRAVQPAGSIQQGSLTISSNDTVTGSRTFPVRLSVFRILSVGIQPAWNILSVPVAVPDYAKSTLFPSATTSAFRYEPGSGYVSDSMLANGRGYWLRFPAAETRLMAGFPIDADTFSVPAGWNIIGSISGSVAVDSIGSIPGGIVTSPFYSYGTMGYEQAATITPGKGYWVKVTQPGSLVLSSIPPPMAKIRIVPTGEMPPAPPGEVTAESNVEKPREFALGQNYPNPFNPISNFGFRIAKSGMVELVVFDLLGRQVATLVNEPKEPGVYTVQWDASGVSSGVYFYRLTAGDFVQTRKMVVVR